MTDQATADQKLDFLTVECRKALAIFAALPFSEYFRRNQEGDKLALAIEQASDHIAVALNVLKAHRPAATAHEVHNNIAGDIVRQIVKPTLEAGAQFTDVLVLLESVVTGVMLVAVKLGGDEIVLDTFIEGVRTRMAEIRLAPLQPKGQA